MAQTDRGDRWEGRSTSAEATAATSSTRMSLLSPCVITFLGAADRSVWSQVAYDNLHKLEFGGRFYLVKRRGCTVHGKTVVISAETIGESVDVALDASARSTGRGLRRSAGGRYLPCRGAGRWVRGDRRRRASTPTGRVGLPAVRALVLCSAQQRGDRP